MRGARRAAGGLAVLVCFGSCGAEHPGVPELGVSRLLAPTVPTGTAGDGHEADVPRIPHTLDALFEQAGAEFHVPAELLEAAAYAETRWQMVEGAPEHRGQPAVHGLMGLKGRRLTEAARLAGITVEAARTEPLANIRAAAALMANDAWELGIDTAQLGAWAPVVARYSGIASPEGQAAYVHHDVYAVLREGAAAFTLEGETAVRVPSRPVQAHFARPTHRTGAAGSAPDYPGGIWRPSPNHNTRPAGTAGLPTLIVIHTCEGAYTACWSWLTHPAAGASSHYVVREDGAEVTQLVREADRAWHVGASYDCSLNGDAECWRNGTSVNGFSIGIEHAGYATQPEFPRAQLDASARLACDISRDHAIPRDRFHLVGHGQLQPYNRSDPGPAWPWSLYLARVNAACSNEVLVVDSDNALNDVSRARVEVSASWARSSAVPGSYGSGYHQAPAGPVSDGASFWFHLPEAATRTVEAWWTGGPDRSPSAPFVVLDASGTRLGAVQVDQRREGSRWNTLGTWTFPGGWNRVVLSRWSRGGGVVVADAVRIR
jgi:N-acetyl-anhydromuramyl-L-alanine amidase AmpD